MLIIPREDWGARHPAGFAAAPLPARELYLHHSVTIAPDLLPPFDDDDAAVRTLEKIGHQRFGGGISYTFAVTPVGRVYEGHGIARRGAHTGGRNSIARAICLVGNYDTATPPAIMVRAVAELVAHGHRADWWPDRLTGGHRDAPGAETACPGRHAHALIPEINRQVAVLLGAPAPRPSPVPRPGGTAMSVRDDVWQGPIDDLNRPGKPQAWEHLQRANAYAERAMRASESLDARLARVEAGIERLLAAARPVATPAASSGAQPAVAVDLTARLDELAQLLRGIATTGVDAQTLASAVAVELAARLREP